MTEAENIVAYQHAMRSDDECHWTRGQLAAEWTEKWSRGRTDGAYAKLVSSEGFREESPEAIRQHRVVFQEFPTQVGKCSWTHHREALEICETAEAAKPWLEKAAREKLSVRQMVQSIRDDKRKDEKPQLIRAEQAEECNNLAELVSTSRTFGTIYADPPWQYGNQATRASTDNHYNTMSIEDLALLPVDKLAAEQSHLHLWTTNGFLKEALYLMEDVWGFEFKSTFVWVKPQMGMGNYWRNSHEIMLTGVRGGLVFKTHDQMSWLEHPRGEHSAKPDIIRTKIEAVSPGPRLEMFGRELVSGWTVFGNQIEKKLIA